MSWGGLQTVQITQLLNEIAVLPDVTITKEGSTYIATDKDNHKISQGSAAATVINAALSSLTAGGLVLIKRGTYAIGATLDYDNDDIVIQGEGFGTVLDFSTLPDGNQSITMTSRSALRNLKVKGSIATLKETLGSDKIVLGDYCIVENVWITDMAFGLEFEDASHCRVRGVRIENIRDDDDQAAALHFTGANCFDNIVDGFFIAASNRAIEHEDGCHDQIVMNGYIDTIKNYNESGNENFSLGVHSHDDGGKCYNCVFKNIYMNDCEFPVVRHAGTTFADSDIHENITFENITVNAPNLVQAINGVNITFRNVNITSSTLDCFVIGRKSRHVLIEHCECNDLRTTKKFYSDNHADIENVIVRDCRIVCNSDKGTDGHYIIDIRQGAHIIIESVVVRDAKGFSAIRAASSASKVTVKDCYIDYAASDPANHGIWIEAPDCIVENNRFGTGAVTSNIVCRDASGSVGRCVITKNAMSDKIIWLRNTYPDVKCYENILSGTASITVEATPTRVSVFRNIGYVTEAHLLSSGFAIDSTGVKTVTIAHGLAAAPAIEDVSIAVVEDTDVDDWAFDLLKVESVDGTNIVVKINVSTASATSEATAKIAAKVHRE